MKKSRAADALRFIRDHRCCTADNMAIGIRLNLVDADGFTNPVALTINRLYRAGYVVGWLHGAGLIKIEFIRRKIPRGAARLRITRTGSAFLGEHRPRKAKKETCEKKESKTSVSWRRPYF